MIFAQRIAQFDRVFTESDCAARQKLRSSLFVETARRHCHAQICLEIVSVVRRARRREAAAVRPRHFIYAIGADDFLDQIDISPEVAAITRNCPGRSRLSFLTLTRALTQSEPLQGLID